MKYLCLVYVEPQIFARIPADERAALDRDSLAYDETLKAQGHYVLAAALQSVSTAKTVRNRQGRVSATDGPFAETKEILAGFIFIEATDMDTAVAIAGRIPMARYGSIEVRAELNFG